MNDDVSSAAIQSLMAQDPSTYSSANIAALLSAITNTNLDLVTRVKLGELLSTAGDPRIFSPEDSEYWTLVTRKGISLNIGRYMVTTAEWRRFINSDAYKNDANWCEAGIQWRDSERPSWHDLASGEDVEQLVYSNQPVVGVSWYEASAYAKAHGARLLNSIERSVLVRGDEKRPYPWGDPFGRGNANTLEERLGRPCAVGLFANDRVPEAVFDLAGNVAEWTSTGEASKKAYHPGSWKQPSMAAWGKAVQLISPSARSDELGFRLAKPA